MSTARSTTLTRESDRRATARMRLWSLREDVLVEADPDCNRLVVITRWGETRLDDADYVVRESLRRMSLGPISLDNVLRAENSGAGGNGGDRREEWARLAGVLDLLSGSVVHSLGMYEGPLLSAVPVARAASFQLREIEADKPARLSKFAAMRAVDDELLLESPLAAYQVVLHREQATSVVAALSTACTVSELAQTLAIPQPIVADILAYLVATGIVLLGEWQEGSGPWFAEDHDPSLVRWSHHDLLFHARSRLGRYGGPTGAVFPHADRLPSPPLVKQAPKGPRFPLYRPALPELLAGKLERR